MIQNRMKSIPVMCVVTVSLSVFSTAPTQAQLTGMIKIDGSSTVAPISTAAAEQFNAVQPKVRVTVGTSGTGGGFKKFLDTNESLRTDINDASRPIKTVEIESARKIGIEFIELPVALDGLAIVAHPSNTFCDHLTLDELKRIWEPESKINNWSQVRAGFPDMPLKLYGAGTDSGTFDYFTEAVMGKEKASRADYTASENDNALVIGVSGDKGSLGYFGYSYYEVNAAKLKLLGIAGADGKAVKPTLETVRGGTYALSRPLFLYVNAKAAERPDVQAFIKFFFDNAKAIVEDPSVAYVSLSDSINAASRSRFEKRVTGTVYGGTAKSSKSLEELYLSR